MFDLPSLLRDLALNLVAIMVLAYGLYFRRYGRRDLFLGYVAFNVSLFSVSAALGSAPINLGLGFGLFAVLSIVRLRSDETTQIEIGYTMVSLVTGLLLGLPGLAFGNKVLFTALLVGAMALADHPILVSHDRNQRYRVDLEVIHDDVEALKADLERRLGGEVQHLEIQRIDYIRDTTRVDVRLRVPRRPRAGARR